MKKILSWVVLAFFITAMPVMADDTPVAKKAKTEKKCTNQSKCAGDSTKRCEKKCTQKVCTKTDKTAACCKDSKPAATKKK